MSYIQKSPRTTSKKKMITRQQVSDVLSYGHIITNLSYAKSTQIFLERLITISKKPSLASRRRAYGILLRTKKFTRDELVNRLFSEIAEKYKNVNGGCTRLLKTEKGALVQLI